MVKNCYKLIIRHVSSLIKSAGTLLLLLLPSRFSCVQPCATPQTAAHQAPPSLGFSRQEHWSGLPFLSPMHEGEKVKVKLLSRVRLLPTPWTATHQSSPSMGFSKQEYWSGVPLSSPPLAHCYMLKLLMFYLYNRQRGKKHVSSNITQTFFKILYFVLKYSQLTMQ